jgi:hypothetical protein
MNNENKDLPESTGFYIEGGGKVRMEGNKVVGAKNGFILRRVGDVDAKNNEHLVAGVTGESKPIWWKRWLREILAGVIIALIAGFLLAYFGIK